MIVFLDQRILYRRHVIVQGIVATTRIPARYPIGTPISGAIGMVQIQTTTPIAAPHALAVAETAIPRFDSEVIALTAGDDIALTATAGMINSKIQLASAKVSPHTN